MNSNLGLTTILMATAGVMSFASAASAAVFSTGDQLNITFRGFQLNFSSGIPGAGDNNIDALFGPTIPDGDAFVSAENPLLDASIAFLKWVRYSNRNEQTNYEYL